MKKAIVLLSGGLDSSTCLAIAKAAGFSCYALSFSYGQKQSSELVAAEKIAQRLGCQHHQIIDLPIGQLGGSALTDPQIAVPAYTGSEAIPVTYVPARNTIFLSIALGWAEIIEAEAIFLGISAVDYSGYPDCRPEYLAAFQAMANLATKAGVEGSPIRIEAPLIHLSKAQTIALGHSLGLDYGMTVSCYQANLEGLACGVCDSCELRKRGFEQAEVADPTKYATYL